MNLTLFCAVVGVETETHFLLNRGEYSETVGHLKDAIAVKQKYDFAANTLKLYLAKKNGAWLDELDTTLSDELVRTTYGSMLVGISKLSKIFGSDNLLGEEVIHVLVVVPEDAVRNTTAAATPSSIEQVMMYLKEMKEVLQNQPENLKKALRDEELSEIIISNCTQSKETELLRYLGFEYFAIPAEEMPDDSIPGYTWSELSEKHIKLRKSYCDYIQRHLRDAMKEGKVQKYFLVDVSENKQFLNCSDPNHRFKLKGTTDQIIVNDLGNRMDYFAGLYFVIEIKKKKPGKKEQSQLFLQLLASDLLSENQCTPIGLLTNLSNYWYFLWFTKNKKVARVLLTCPANGFKFIKQVLEDRSELADDGAIPMQFSFLNSPILLKRQKLFQHGSGAVLEELERYEVMSDELNSKFLKHRRIEYALDLVRQMPVHSAMYG